MSLKAWTIVLVFLTASLLFFTILLWQNDAEQPSSQPDTTSTISGTYKESSSIYETHPQLIETPSYTQSSVSPAYIWAIIVIGTVLVFAVIVLIVRTRRAV